VLGTRLSRKGLPAIGGSTQGWDLLPVMTGGWDEEAWVAHGLPTGGTMTIELTVYAESQQQPAPGNARRSGPGGR
jgi:hypothetical protein